MERTAGKELALAPLQDWGEESEDGAVFSVTLRRQRSQRSGPGEGPARSQPLPAAADTFLHYRTSKVRALRAARLERLMRELVSGDREQDPGFVPAFLATHHAFVSTARVLRFLLPPPPPPPPPPGPGPANATWSGSGAAGGVSNSSGDALVTRLSTLLRDLPTLKAAVIVACAFSALLIACLLLRVFRSGKRLKKTRKYDIITTPAERVEMAPLNEEDDEDEDSTVFDIKYR
ncbi:PREDICTED: membrane protein FAM174B isoform X2 [Chinchilla lanigera]|nr:PREDICTED: membrane protein FAM174B isoform X1 [Chinchilla lanigera]XP_013368082.1 PREDICTED: membrane protein FAM174B isoform X2 [Chinchilla lanigera]